MDWKKIEFATLAIAAGQTEKNFAKGLELLENQKFAEAKSIFKTIQKRVQIESDLPPVGIFKEELNSAKGFAELGLKNYQEAHKLFSETINRIEKYGFENSKITKETANNKLSNLYVGQGKSLIFLGNTTDGVSLLVEAFNTDNNNIEALFFIVTIYSLTNEINSVDFYTKEIAKCYNDQYSTHRKSLHYHINNNTISDNKSAYERFLRILRSFNLIDDHFFHSKIGKALPQNSLSANEKQGILNEIVQNNISSAFELLLSASKNKPDVFNSTMLLFNNYNKVTMEVRIGIIAKDDENLILNKIKLAMIQLSNDL